MIVTLGNGLVGVTNQGGKRHRRSQETSLSHRALYTVGSYDGQSALVEPTVTEVTAMVGAVPVIGGYRYSANGKDQ